MQRQILWVRYEKTTSSGSFDYVQRRSTILVGKGTLVSPSLMSVQTETHLRLILLIESLESNPTSSVLGADVKPEMENQKPRGDGPEEAQKRKMKTEK